MDDETVVITAGARLDSKSDMTARPSSGHGARVWAPGLDATAHANRAVGNEPKAKFLRDFFGPNDIKGRYERTEDRFFIYLLEPRTQKAEFATGTDQRISPDHHSQGVTQQAIPFLFKQLGLQTNA